MGTIFIYFFLIFFIFHFFFQYLPYLSILTNFSCFFQENAGGVVLTGSNWLVIQLVSQSNPDTRSHLNIFRNIFLWTQFPGFSISTRTLTLRLSLTIMPLTILLCQQIVSRDELHFSLMTPCLKWCLLISNLRPRTEVNVSSYSSRIFCGLK